jgi:hypothetical protein
MMMTSFGFVLMFSGLAGCHGPLTLGGNEFEFVSGRDIRRKCRQLQAGARVRLPAKWDRSQSLRHRPFTNTSVLNFFFELKTNHCPAER